MSYTKLLKKLYQVKQFHPNKDGLQNIHAINNYLGNPLNKIPIIHVAGTNGKVAKKIRNIMIHLMNIREAFVLKLQKRFGFLVSKLGCTYHPIFHHLERE